MANRTACCVDGCGRPVHGLDLCHAHSWRLRNHGDVGADRPVRGRDKQRYCCSVDGCGAQAKTRGMCGRHYLRTWKHGDPHVNLNAPVPLLDRLLRKVQVDPSGCWLWTGGRDAKGYGAIRADGKTRRAHRVSYELFVAPVPDGLDLDHLCRVPSCCRPDHLEPVTSAENQRRGLKGVLKTTCKNGHPYTSDNVKFDFRGRRFCAICNNDAQLRSRARTRLAREEARRPGRT